MSTNDDEAIPPAKVVRRHLLTATIDEGRTVARIEVKEVTLFPRQRSGLHLHPCPVVGSIIKGTILYQLQGQSSRELRPGDAFFEPANTRVSHFDNVTDEPATFIACYLLGGADQDLITMLEEN